jgi:hypothetical protein
MNNRSPLLKAPTAQRDRAWVSRFLRQTSWQRHLQAVATLDTCVFQTAVAALIRPRSA